VALAFGVSPLAGGGILPSYVNNIHHIVKHCATRIQNTVNEGASRRKLFKAKTKPLGNINGVKYHVVWAQAQLQGTCCKTGFQPRFSGQHPCQCFCTSSSAICTAFSAAPFLI